MILWPVFALMTLVAVLAVWWPLARRQHAVRSGSDVDVYRDQLDEIDRDRAAGLIGGTEAEAARVEVSRRLIAAVETASTASKAATPRRAGNNRWAARGAAGILRPPGAPMTYLSIASPNLVPVSVNAAAGSQALPPVIENT